jgi:hypothetical protein
MERHKLVLTDLRAVGIRGQLDVLEGPAFRAKIGQGRKGFPGNRTIVQNIDPRPGGSATNIGVYAVCGGSASFVCEPPDRGSQVRNGLAAGGRWIRTLGPP